MLKKNFVTLIMSVISCLFLGLGMCMTMLPAWNAYDQGLIVGVIGIALFVIMILVRRKMEGKQLIAFNAKAVFTVLFGIAAALALGAGMCMAMLWNMMIQGIALGTAGIVALLCLIPICKGLR